ncbi:MAG: 16S rRNA (cytidine(1402)-2'-O)-methyltransferase [Clostridia bacterium]|nr:16S rRNA (cytidine(1402)-2'-O)-methyltransferase [Clostridia bacterium]
MDNTEKNKIEKSTLYLVGTPIGNLSDLSERAKKVLSEVDFIAAEDTRNSQKLLSIFGIKNELIAYHEHNRREAGERIAARLAVGESCALITDAGMPAISDPGEDIVRLCGERGITVKAVPGPSASVTALALSGLPTGRFAFEGFLPPKEKARADRLRALLSEERTMIFYEAPHRLRETLAAMCEAFGGERRASLSRELTKINEETERGTLGELCGIYEGREPRGEYVIVVAGGHTEEDSSLLSLMPREHVEYYERAGLSRMDAIKAAAKDRGISKSEMYKLVVE